MISTGGRVVGCLTGPRGSLDVSVYQRSFGFDTERLSWLFVAPIPIVYCRATASLLIT